MEKRQTGLIIQKRSKRHITSNFPVSSISGASF